MPENIPRPITLARSRATAAADVAAGSGLSPLTAGLVVDLVDITTTAILSAVGLSPIEVRRAAATIWGGR